MKILFLHGWTSIPGGVKPTFLKDHGHEVINPALPDDDFAEAVRIAEAEFDQHQHDVVFGSSRGGAIAMNSDSGQGIRLGRFQTIHALAHALRILQDLPLERTKQGRNPEPLERHAPIMVVFTPVKPGQRRCVFAFGQSMIVKVVMNMTFEDGKWTCLTEPHSDPVFIAESEFGDVLPEHCEPKGLCHDRI